MDESRFERVYSQRVRFLKQKSGLNKQAAA